MDTSNTFREKYLELLETAKDERSLHTFLKENPIEIRNAFNAWAWNHVSVLPEFQLSNKYRFDFLVLSADSGQWHTNFVELKSPIAKIFNKNGSYAKYLNQALNQINEKIAWIQSNDHLFREHLSDYLKAKQVGAKCSNADDHTLASTEILDYRTVIDKNYYVIIGRRNMISLDHQRKRNLVGLDKIKIVTYDRLLDSSYQDRKV